MQTYKNHAHRPLLTAVGYWFVGIALISFWLRWRATGDRLLIGLFALCAAVIVLLMISRRYTTRLQDRIIKLEIWSGDRWFII